MAALRFMHLKLSHKRETSAGSDTPIDMDTAHFKHLLELKQQELVGEIAKLEEEARGAGEPEVRDSADDATADQGISESLDEGTAASQTLTQVRDALKRINSGTYSRCIQCGKQIPEARLEAVPWAAYCVEDQEKIDRATHAQTGGSSLG